MRDGSTFFVVGILWYRIRDAVATAWREITWTKEQRSLQTLAGIRKEKK